MQQVSLTLDIPDKPREVIPIQTLQELRAKGLSYGQIGKIVGCSMQAAWERLQPFREELDQAEVLKDVEGKLQDALKMRLIKSLLSADLEKVPYGTKALAYCQIYDKARLERGQATAITADYVVLRARLEIEDGKK